MRPSMRMGVFWTAALTACMASVASAQEVSGPTTPTASHRWTEESAFTVGAGSNVFTGAVGYPGLDLKLIHGLDATTDVNAHVGLNYAFEGITRGGARFEFTGQVGIRKELASFGDLKLAGRFDPGILAASSPGVFGIKIPFGLELGIPFGPQLTANASFDIPMYFTLGDFNAFYVPLLFGGGVEYLVNPNLAVTAKIKMGPTFGTNGFGTAFTLYALVGAAYKF